MQNRYLIGKVLGQGGFGITYLGWDDYLDIPVAIKEYYPNGVVMRDSSQSLAVTCCEGNTGSLFQSNRDRFLREAKALAKFSGVPEIVHVQNVFQANNTAYIVMEYVKGTDLRRYINMRGGRLTAEETFTILRPVMEALSRVHEAGLVHRDISPDNIMLQPDGGAKLLDFGAAREVFDASVDKNLSQSTEAILKHGFAPMEQYQKRGSLGPWTDVYALCATIYYCLTGQVPPDAPARMMEDIHPDWRSIPGLTEQQIAALEKGMELQPSHRMGSVGELCEALFTVNPEPVLKSGTILQPEPPKKNLMVITAAVLAVIVLLAGMIYDKSSEDKDSLMTNTPAWGITVPQHEMVAPETSSPTEDPAEIAYLEAEAHCAALEDQGEYVTILRYLEGQIGSGGADARYTKLLEQYQQKLKNTTLLSAENSAKTGQLCQALQIISQMQEEYDCAEFQSVFAQYRLQLATNQIAAGREHSVCINSDGTVSATGDNSEGQCSVRGWDNAVAISVGDYHTVVLREDTSVMAVGRNDFGQCEVSSWRNIRVISAGDYHTVGVTSDGEIVATGRNSYGQCDVHELYSASDVVSVAAGYEHTVALHADGTVSAVGSNKYNQCDVSSWHDIVAVYAGTYHTVGLRIDGTVVATGENKSNQCDVGSWSDISALSAGDYFTMGLKSDGTVITCGQTQYGQAKANSWTEIIAIAGGKHHALGMTSTGKLLAVGENDSGQCDVYGFG